MTFRKTRREFLLHSALGAAALAMGATLHGAGDAQPQDKDDKERAPVLCCDTYSFNRDFKAKKITLEQIPALYKELGIGAIAWNDLYFESFEKDYLDKLNQAAKDAGCRAVCLIMEGNLAADSEETRRKQIEDNTRKLKVASALGVGVVRMNLGSTGRDEDDETIGVERCIAAFRELLPIAKELAIKITIENHGGCSRTADRILKVIHGTDPAWVGSCLDFGNWPKEPKELRYAEIEKLAPFAYHTHVKTHSFTPEGEEASVDYARAFEIMRKANYRGPVSIEWEGKEPAEPVEGVKLSRDLIRKHWPQVR